MIDDPQAYKFVRADQLGPVKPRVPEENATRVVNGALDLHWVGPGYCWELDRIQTPHDLISMMHHLMCKKSDRAKVTHFMGLLQAVYHAKGWSIYGKAPAPPPRHRPPPPKEMTHEQPQIIPRCG